ncbi:MAG: hypothetical protein IVW54_02555 [Candidatus Binataceae bacterium]|nr:hypothetical protein [Candidatus Binataceae bacterium]
MPRANPGPFEPIVYLIQSPVFYRVVGLGGFALFTIVALAIAAAHGFGYLLAGLILFAANWYDMSYSICRRCRFYGTWHCAGQGMLVARMFSPLNDAIGEWRMRLHFLLTAIVLVYGLYWVWHFPALGILFTLWLPIAGLSATSPGGFSWRARPAVG